MKPLALDHILIPSHDVEASRIFYRDVLELEEMVRPNFNYEGLWFRITGPYSIHIVKREGVTTRGDKHLDTFDVHFALRMKSYTETLAWLHSKGFDENAAPDAMNALALKPHSIAGRPQLYVLDPCRNVIEFICDEL